jgi:cell wall-associated NlpC family hydrolase
MTGKSRRSLAWVVAIAAIAAVIAPTSLIAAPDPSDLEAARDRLMELEREFQLVSEEYNLVHDRLVAIQAEMAQSRLVVGKLEDRMGTRRHAAIQVATELYMADPAAVAIETVLSARSLADVESRLAYLKASQGAQRQVFEKLQVDQALLEENLKLLEAARVKAANAEARLADLRTEIEGKVADQKDEVSVLNAAIERARRRAAAAAETVPAPGIPVVTTNIRAAPAPNPRAQAAVDAALSQVGKPYQWGAAGPDSYDCSGLTMWAWSHAGVGLPHNSGAQYSATPRVERSDIAPGDLLFFGSPIHHVAMYIGNGQMVEAPYSGQVVRVVSASRSDYVGAGRPGV